MTILNSTAALIVGHSVGQPNGCDDGGSGTTFISKRVTQADPDDGSVVNLATASAVYNGNSVESNQDSVTVEVLPGPPNYTISKKLTSYNNVSVGSQISFTTLTVVPLEDTYDKNYLAFAGVPFGFPQPDDNINDGVINWGDLTGPVHSPGNPPAYGTGLDLAPLEFVEVVVNFVTLLDTGLLDDDETVNTAWGRSVTDEYGTPVTPDKDASDGVVILNPTATLLSDRSLSLTDGVVTLGWTTTEESNMASFQLYHTNAAG